MRHFIIKGLLGCAVALASLLVHAQGPDGPVTWMIPYIAGGGTDATARMLARPLGAALKRAVVIENKPGGGTAIGAAHLAQSRPDGSAIGTLDASTVTVLPHIQSKLPFDAEKSFSYIGGIAVYPWVLVVNPKVPANNLQELIALAKAKPGQLTFGTPNPKGNAYLSMERFQEAAKVKLVHVPYRGDAAGIQDLLAGQIDMYLANTLAILPHVSAGKLRPLAVGRLKRLAVFPNVPTFDEQGLKGFQTYGWQALAAPAGTPPEVIQRLNAELNKLLTTGETARQLVEMGVEPFPTTPAEMVERARIDWIANKPLIERLGLREN